MDLSGEGDQTVQLPRIGGMMGFSFSFLVFFLTGKRNGRTKSACRSAEKKEIHMKSGTTRINDQKNSKENSRFLQSKRMEDQTKCG